MSVTSTEKKRRFIMFSLLGAALAAVILAGSMMLFAPKKPSTTSNLGTARTDAVKAQAGGEGSEEYNKNWKPTTSKRPMRRSRRVKALFLLLWAPKRRW